MIRETNFAPNEYYHIYSRGVEKRKIFLDKNDYLRFSILLYLTNNTENFHLSDFFREKSKDNNWVRKSKELFSLPKKDNLVSIISYCQMPNHFHLIIKENNEGGISKFMKKLLTAYSMYFNIKNKRSGPLFVRPFRSKHIDDDNYFKYLLSYIHLNPVKIIQSDWKENGIKNKKEAEDYLNTYNNSSYLDFIGKRRVEKIILNLEDMPDYFSNHKEFDDFMKSWLEYSTMVKDSPPTWVGAKIEVWKKSKKVV